MEKKFKFVFNRIGYRWAVLMFGNGSFQISLDHNSQNLSVGVSFDRWVLSKQLTLSFLTISLVLVWYVSDNSGSIYKY